MSGAGEVVSDTTRTVTCIWCGHDGTHSDDEPCLHVLGPCRCEPCAHLSEPIYAELCMCPGEDGQ